MNNILVHKLCVEEKRQDNDAVCGQSILMSGKQREWVTRFPAG